MRLDQCIIVCIIVTYLPANEAKMYGTFTIDGFPVGTIDGFPVGTIDGFPVGTIEDYYRLHGRICMKFRENRKLNAEVNHDQFTRSCHFCWLTLLQRVAFIIISKISRQLENSDHEFGSKVRFVAAKKGAYV